LLNNFWTTGLCEKKLAPENKLSLVEKNQGTSQGVCIWTRGHVLENYTKDQVEYLKTKPRLVVKIFDLVMQRVFFFNIYYMVMKLFFK